MSVQHTPGPWAWETPMGEHCPWIVQAGKQSYEWGPIAELGDCTEDGPSPRSKAFQRVQADARLIAAAPELLEALEALDCSDILGVAESCASGLPRWDHVSRKINAARAAIAKATGATP